MNMARSCPASDDPSAQLTSTVATACYWLALGTRSKPCVSVAAGLAPSWRSAPALVGMVESRIERGIGNPDLDVLQRIALALDRPLIVSFGGRDPSEAPADAGHLAIQELVLRLGRAVGYTGSFELPTRPAEPWRSADVGLASDARRWLIHAECWNTIGDVGAAARSSARKLAESRGVLRSLGGAATARLASCWIVRATARNRALIARYPEVFASRFPGSSRGWVDALVTGSAPPSEPGLVWCDVGGHAPVRMAPKVSIERRPVRIPGGVLMGDANVSPASVPVAAARDARVPVLVRPGGVRLPDPGVELVEGRDPVAVRGGHQLQRTSEQ